MTFLGFQEISPDDLDILDAQDRLAKATEDLIEPNQNRIIRHLRNRFGVGGVEQVYMQTGSDLARVDVESGRNEALDAAIETIWAFTQVCLTDLPTLAEAERIGALQWGNKSYREHYSPEALITKILEATQIDPDNEVAEVDGDCLKKIGSQWVSALRYPAAWGQSEVTCERIGWSTVFPTVVGERMFFTDGISFLQKQENMAILTGGDEVEFPMADSLNEAEELEEDI